LTRELVDRGHEAIEGAVANIVGDSFNAICDRANRIGKLRRPVLKIVRSPLSCASYIANCSCTCRLLIFNDGFKGVGSIAGEIGR
jgi:hypothetical protein